MPRVFVKLANGSSASGVVALATAPDAARRHHRGAGAIFPRAAALQLADGSDATRSPRRSPH